MRKVSENVHVEFYLAGCNPGFLVTDDGVFMIDTPQGPMDGLRWWERVREYGPVRYLVNTEPHLDHHVGNAFCQGVEVVAQAGFGARYEKDMVYMTTPGYLEWVKKDDPDSEWLVGHPGFPPNPPTRTFTDEITLRLGERTIRCVNVPGHTAEQTHVHLPEEGVLFTGDNVFCRTKTFIQEGSPWEWLAALDWIDRLENVDVIVPGHGEPCDVGYVAEQRQILQNWIDVVQSFVDRGLTEEEAVAMPLDTVSIDPYPLGQRLFTIVPHLDQMNVRNLYRQIRARGSEED
ncbi:MBL fold metallo-hydrolase [Streptomyces sp. NPDC002643]